MKKIIILVFINCLIFVNNTLSEEVLKIREGNIDAKIEIIIYESLTCGFCANFHNEVYPKLKKEFIDEGLVSIEFRNFPLDLAALNASKLAHCKNNGSSDFLHTLYKNQETWKKGNNILEINNNLKKLVDDTSVNLDFETCVQNKDLEDFILEERIEGTKKYDIQSTPTLIINEKKFDKTLNYKNLKKYLKKMI